MAQDYGPAQPIADWVNKYVGGPVRTVTGLLNRLPDPPRGWVQSPDSSRGVVDTSWHNEMLRNAMRSAQIRQDADRAAAAAAAASAASPTPARRIVKRTPTRTPARSTARR